MIHSGEKGYIIGLEIVKKSMKLLSGNLKRLEYILWVNTEVPNRLRRETVQDEL